MEVTFHIGLHKTGTTFLQRSIFPKFDNVHTADHKLHNILGFRASRGLSNVLVSHEIFSGHPFKGDWIGEFYRTVDALTLLFPNAKCIVGFRRHDKLIMSLYKQYIREGGVRTFDQFFSLNENRLIKCRDLRFQERFEFLESRFKALFVYTTEALNNSPVETISAMADFVGAEWSAQPQILAKRINVGLEKQLALTTLRRLNVLEETLEALPFAPSLNNHLFRAMRLNPEKLCSRFVSRIGKRKIGISQEVTQGLLQEFSDDWRFIEAVAERRV